jgi:hypothetical protein
MSLPSMRFPGTIVVLAASLTFLSGCMGYDDYTDNYWARPDYSYAHNGDYHTYHAAQHHYHCYVHGKLMSAPRHADQCYSKNPPRAPDYGFSDL